MLLRVIGKLNNIVKEHPIKFSIGTSVSQAFVGDHINQRILEGKEKANTKRTLAALAFGFVYIGGILLILFSFGEKCKPKIIL